MSVGQRTADTAIFGAAVCTVDPRRAVTEDLAVAVLGGEIIAVGSSEEVRAWCGPSTEVIDGTGRLVLPGIVDAHVHPPMAGIEMVRCNLSGFGVAAGGRWLPSRMACRSPRISTSWWATGPSTCQTAITTAHG